MRTALIEPHYMPCIAYFSALAFFDEILVEKFEHYEKQSYRNRCHLKGPDRIEILTVPVVRRHGKPVTAEVEIDYGQKWLNNHWRTIRTLYGKAAFFEYYAPDLHDILFKKPVFLCDLNLQIMTLCLKWLKPGARLRETSSYKREPPAGVTDLRGRIHPKKEDACNGFYKSTEYPQVFGSKFVPNLSIIDLIFNQGPAASVIVKASAVK